jgi:hypothetical protein
MFEYYSICEGAPAGLIRYLEWRSVALLTPYTYDVYLLYSVEYGFRFSLLLGKIIGYGGLHSLTKVNDLIGGSNEGGCLSLYYC